MKTIKKIIIACIYFSLLIGLIVFHDPINKFIVENYIYTKKLEVITYNEYAKKTDYEYLKITSDFKTENKTDLLNNIYTIVDSGIDSYTFYCANDYDNCIQDVEDLSNDTNALTIINNFVHPFNSFNKLYISTNSMGKITITLDKLYKEDEITYTLEKMNNIIDSIITENMSNRDKIKAFHDYIINTTVYDEERSSEIKNNVYTDNIFNSHKASGVLENHIALCSGYTDITALFLNMLGIKNYKISNIDHIWNGVFLDDNWYHLDLTWDDPVTNTGENILINDFFLITNNEMINKETTQHSYDANIYKEIVTNN